MQEDDTGPEENQPDQSGTTGCDSDSAAEGAPERPPAAAVETEAMEVVRQESRNVLDEQIALLSDIDDKAMRTVRTSVLLVGLVISAIQLSDSSISVDAIGTWPFRLAAAGVTFLLVSIVAGIYTYSVSDPEFGVSADHRTDVVAGAYTEHEWLRFQLNEYDEWTESMRETNENNVVGLHVTLFSLVAGLLSLLSSVVWTTEITSGTLFWPAVAAVLLVALVAAVLWVTRGNG